MTDHYIAYLESENRELREAQQALTRVKQAHQHCTPDTCTTLAAIAETPTADHT